MTRYLGLAARLAAFCAVLGVFAAGLASCAPHTDRLARDEGIGTARAPYALDPTARLADHEFIAADGVALPLRVWLPPGDGPGRVRAVILALHGFNDYSNAFAIPAKEWAKDGIATYAYDQRGFGRAPDHGLWPGRAPLAADAATAVRLLRRRYPGTPVYLLGESMGAAVAIVAETGESGTQKPDVDGIILAAPAVWGYETMNLPERVALWAMVRLFPTMTLTGRQLHIVPCDNRAVLEALSRDPLVIKETRVDAVYGLVNLMSAALDAAPKLTVPLLLQYGARDQVVPRAPVQLFVGDLPRAPDAARRLAYYPHGYHMIYRDLDGATVADDVGSWVLDRSAPLPSREDAAQNTRPWPPTPAQSG
ncbi:MAG TPA: alpha/beta hydrolase [Stellaceae bacterium]|jgi:alpha-beta hydrolase superfamily lysophospholipase